MKIARTMALVATLALASTMAGAQNFHGDGYRGYARHGGWQSRDVALPYGPSAAEQSWFDRASRNSGGGY